MTYAYTCKDCGEVHERFFKTIQKDPKPPEKCIKCGHTEFSRNYDNAGTLYNCTGFYCTDVKGHGAGRRTDKENKQ